MLKEKQKKIVKEKQKGEEGNEVEVEVEKEVLVPVVKEIEEEVEVNRLFELSGVDSSLKEKLPKLLAKKSSFFTIFFVIFDRMIMLFIVFVVFIRLFQTKSNVFSVGLFFLELSKFLLFSCIYFVFLKKSGK